MTEQKLRRPCLCPCLCPLHYLYIFRRYPLVPLLHSPHHPYISCPSCTPSFLRSNVVFLRAHALLARGHGRLQSPDDRARARTVREALAPDATASAAQDATTRRPYYAVSAFSPVAAPSSAASASLSPEKYCRSRLLVAQCHLLILRLRHRYIKEASVSISSI